MPFWNTNKLRHECQALGLITPYREERAMRCAYELGVGPEAFVTSKPDDTTHLSVGNKVTIPPGQFGLLITREIIFVPETAIAFISIRARIKFQGLVNVSGFHVDPGFRGQLKFAVYNAGSKDIVLDQDERVFMIWYADLNAASPDPYGPVPAAPSVITAEDVSRLKGEVASPAQLKKQIEEMKVDLDKKIHEVEQTKLFNRSIMFAILTAVLMIFFASFVKPYFDGTNKNAANAVATRPVDALAPEAHPLPASLLDDLGLYILASGGIAAVGAIIGGVIGGLIVRKRQ